jgi:hypothetical protein
MKPANWLAILLALCLFASFAVVACGDDDNDDNDDGGGGDDDDDDETDNECAWYGTGQWDVFCNGESGDSSDPQFEHCKVYTFSQSGNLLSEGSDINCDGILSVQEEDTYYEDYTDVYCYSYEYDAVGRLISSKLRTYCEEEPDSCQKYFYNEKGWLERIEYDGEPVCDGTPWQCVLITYDGNNGEWFEDFDCDGEPDNEDCPYYYITVDNDGNILTKGRDDDDSCDGVTEYHVTYTYDSDGRMTSREDDGGTEGGWDREVYTYDEHGRYKKVEELEEDEHFGPRCIKPSYEECPIPD